mmetsp:Transcript_12803/g.27319  ORF Transcript_12803/g.27319 Transcript_12803/m.27319 type:complete len:202 (+) Transcript_12803:215-820(+)
MSNDWSSLAATLLVGSRLCYAACLGALAPKMVEPTRTCVAPAATASSKSCDMPILSESDAASTPSHAATRSLHSTRQLKSAPAPPSSAEYLPMHMRPHTRKRAHELVISATSFSTSLGAQPLLLSSPEVFTCTITARGRSRRTCAARFCSSAASFAESTVWMHSSDGTDKSSFTLFVCKWPMKWKRASAGISGAFATTSCT